MTGSVAPDRKPPCTYFVSTLASQVGLLAILGRLLPPPLPPSGKSSLTSWPDIKLIPQTNKQAFAPAGGGRGGGLPWVLLPAAGVGRGPAAEGVLRCEKESPAVVVDHCGKLCHVELGGGGGSRNWSTWCQYNVNGLDTMWTCDMLSQ